ncbi:MAG: PKD domain-containing protein [Longimicrobiaceae bacterium]
MASGAASGATATVSLRATDATSAALQASGSFVSTVAATPRKPGLSWSVPEVSAGPGETATNTLTVTNNGNVARTFCYQPSKRAGNVPADSVFATYPAAACESYGPFQARSFPVGFTVRGTAQGGWSARAGLHAVDQADGSAVSDTASFATSVRTAPASPTVTPPANQADVAGVPRTVVVTVRNNGNASRTFRLAATSSSTMVVGDPADPADVTVDAFGQQSVSLAYTPVGKGSAIIAVTATDTQDASKSHTAGFTSMVANRGPTASFTAPSPVYHNQAFTLNAAGSSDPDGDALTYRWRFGDNTTGTGATPTKSYAVDGTYTVTLTVSDGADSATATREVLVVNRTPTAQIYADRATAETGVSIFFSGAGSTDPDGDALDYTWSWGDGSAARTGPTASHAYSTAGAYTVTLTVSDGRDAPQSTTATVTISAPDAQGPAIEFVRKAEAPAPGQVSVDVNWRDPSGVDRSSLLYSWNGQPASFVNTPETNAPWVQGSTSLIFSEGNNVLRVYGRDVRGNESRDSVVYLYDTMGPKITITRKATASAEGQVSLVVDWEDPSGVDQSTLFYTWNGQPTTFYHTPAENAAWVQGSTSLILGVGDNVLKVYGKDVAGRADSASVTYQYLDTQPPTVGFSHADGHTFTEDYRTITIDWRDDHAVDEHTFTIRHNGQVLTPTISTRSWDGHWQSALTLDLQEGANTLEASVADRVGRRASQAITYFYNQAPYAVHVSSAQGAITAPAGAQNLSHTFTVRNAGTQPATFQVAPGCHDAVYDCFRDPGLASLYLAPGQETQVPVTFRTRASGWGDLGLNAHKVDDTSIGSSRTITVQVSESAGAPGVPEVSAIGSGPVSMTLDESRPIEFRVSNPGTAPGTYAFTVDCKLGVLSCLPPQPVTVDPGSSRTVAVQVQAVGVSASPEMVTLAATLNGTSRSASQSVTIAGANGAAPTVALDSATAMPLIERDLCLTFAAGANAAYECGDLRIVHALPGVRTMNKARAPALLYNSQHASPNPLVAANVTLPASRGVPSQLEVVVEINGATLMQPYGQDKLWPAGETRRIAFSHMGLRTLATGVYPYKLWVVASYAQGGPATSAAQQGRLVVVNRSGSSLGAGWWVAGVEQLHFPFDTRPGSPLPDSLVWVGGDGATRIYGGPNGSAGSWEAPRMDRPDRITYEAVPELGTDRYYVRHLSGGVRVVFKSNGQHAATINRLGHRTAFGYDSQGRLEHISVPAGLSYTFDYDSEADVVKVIAPAVTSPGAAAARPRITRIRLQGGRVQSIEEPDHQEKLARWPLPTGFGPVRFGYETGTSRIERRTDRRGKTTSYRYDAGKKLEQMELDPEFQQEVIRVRFRAAESRGSVGAAPALLTDVYTEYDGPRTDATDVTKFWLDRFGSPSTIVNTRGKQTAIARNDPNWPTLVTGVEFPNGRRLSATYYADGNLETSTDLTRCKGEGASRVCGATTSYTWDTRWDQVREIRLPEGEITSFHYGDVGNREWQQPGPYTGNDPRRVYFDYHPTTGGTAPGLVRAVRTPGEAAGTYDEETLVYDVRGNLSATRTPLGFYTLYYTDEIGRDTLVISPTAAAAATDPAVLAQAGGTGARTSIEYDLLGQEVERTRYGPPVKHRNASGEEVQTPAEKVTVWRQYDDEGNLESLKRSAEPESAHGALTTGWRYDAAGRVIAEVAPDLKEETTVYDAAGNPKAHTTRRGRTIGMTYDELNRLRTRTIPEHSYGPTSLQVMNGLTFQFPFFTGSADGNLETNNGTNNPGGLVIPGDVEEFDYDEAGNLTLANNRDSRVSRTYNEDGTLRSETQRIRTYRGSDYSKHVYELTYGYDLNGRRTSLTHPQNLAPAAATPQTYGYRAVTGQLETITDVLGNSYEYGYWNNGLLRRLTFPAQSDLAEERWYDRDGRLRHRIRSTGAGSIHSDTLYYDARGKVLSAHTQDDTTNLAYSGLGTLARGYTWTRLGSQHQTEETYRVDALGNRMQSLTAGVDDVAFGPVSNQAYEYEPHTGRLKFVKEGIGSIPMSGAGAESSYAYDAAGNVAYVGSRSYQTSYTVSGALADVPEGTVNYYGADERLRVADRQACYFEFGGCATPMFGKRAAFQEYRYDALGRRVLIRTRSEWACATGCEMSIQRVVWDGDQILYEVKAYGGTGATDAKLEQDTDLVVPPATASDRPKPQGDGYYGRVAYTHGAGIDQPLSFIRMDYGWNWGWDPENARIGPVVVLPHPNWRGQFNTGSFMGNPCTLVREQQVYEDQEPGQRSLCMEVEWPGERIMLFRQTRRQDLHGPVSWMGSLIDDKRDASGNLYMRNRYYDPASGRFTQEDPIGLAGGLNVYGFANGDPVSYSDPYGLCPDACVIETAGIGVIYAAGLAALATGAAIYAGEDLGNALAAGADAGKRGVDQIITMARNKHVEGKIQGEIDVINEHFEFLGGGGGHGDPRDPRNRDKWKSDIRRHLREMKKHIDRLTGDRNKQPWQEKMKQIEEQLRNTQ